MYVNKLIIQGGSNMTGTDLCVNKSQFVPVIFEPPCNSRTPMERMKNILPETATVHSGSRYVCRPEREWSDQQ